MEQLILLIMSVCIFASVNPACKAHIFYAVLYLSGCSIFFFTLPH